MTRWNIRPSADWSASRSETPIKTSATASTTEVDATSLVEINTVTATQESVG